VAYEITSHKSQLLFSMMTMGQYCLGTNKLLDQLEMLSKKFLRNFLTVVICINGNFY